MPVPASQPAQGWWCDIDGAPISLFCWVEQVAEGTESTALPSRLHQQGQVAGWGLGSFYVCFEDSQIVSVSPHLLRLLPDAPSDSTAPLADAEADRRGGRDWEATASGGVSGLAPGSVHCGKS